MEEINEDIRKLFNDFMKEIEKTSVGFDKSFCIKQIGMLLIDRAIGTYE